ncbi:hypothetical protein [Streptomyces sp. NPDC020983]|uniref:hypothetical protein n=1 Tax=Streptomyces sp. NPDC020983 TaxID=3365106 RepID=UPI0037B25631
MGRTFSCLLRLRGGFLPIREVVGPVAALVASVVPLTGLQLDGALSAATSGGDDAPTGAGVLLVVKNADSGSHTVTLATPGTVNGLAIADRAVSVAAGKTELIPLGADYRNPTTGRASITYDGVTSVSVGVVRVSTS